jgi:transcriptional regulator with XRE-family HTH domain
MVKQANSLGRLVTRPGTNDAARILKAWRRHERLSQAAAAARLGVSVRTLQGWELGRPMPHPGLLQISTTMSRPADPFTLGQSEFPREFARFVDFVGANEMINALRRADTKLGSLLPSTRGLYGDRFYFHEQFIRFSEGSAPYQLDISDAIAVRAASLIAGINRVRDSLSRTGASRLQKTIIGNLRPDRDIRQLEHEIRCVAHFGRKGFKVTFADLEGQGRFDLVVETPSGPIELECKTVSEDTGSQIKLEMTVNLMDTFIRDAPALPNTDKSGIFILTLKSPASECKNLVPRFKAKLRCVEQGFERNDFELTFLPRPQWTELLHREQTDELRQAISLDSELAGHAHCFTRVAGSILALCLRPHKPNGLSTRVIDVIKDGADQCTGQRPSVIWLHFIGAAEAEFNDLAQFSASGNGAGLNSLVAGALHPQASSKNRSHVQRILFSASGKRLIRSPMLAPDRLIVRAASNDGPIYDVPNPFWTADEAIQF